MAKRKKRRGAAKRDAAKGKAPRRTEAEHHGAPSRKAVELSGGFLTFAVHGDSCAGEVLAMERGRGKYGEEVKTTLKTKDGGTVTFYAPTLLRNAFEQYGVAVGDSIAVEYTRDVPTGKGNPAKCFRFEHTPGKGGKRRK